MPQDVVDLTKERPSEAFKTISPGDVVLIAATGSVGYLLKEAFKHFFPGRPSVTEQLHVLKELIEACGKAGATSLKVRISTNTKRAFQFPPIVKDIKVLNEDNDVIDLEILFRSPRNSSPTTAGRRAKHKKTAGAPRSSPSD